MFSILHFIEAKARLKESIKTIEMMGGEDECQPMLLGQRDMIELELEYYRYESKKFIGLALLTVIACVTLAYYYLPLKG
jgi:hypothetical protein